MPRQSRIIIPHIAHHITQRGNYRQTVFEEDRDYKKYCELVNDCFQKYGVDIPRPPGAIGSLTTNE